MPTGTRRLAASSSAAVSAFLAVAVLGANTHPNVERLRHLTAEEPHVGTVVRIEAYVPQDVDPAALFRDVFDRVAALEQSFSSYRAKSEIRRVEVEARRGLVPVSKDLFSVLSQSLQIAAETNGEFNPTLGQWTLPTLEGEPPAVRAEAARHRPSDVLKIDAATRGVQITRQDVRLDLGGIAKGYIADAALRILREQGVTHAVVAVAGDIAVGDPPPSKHAWTVALDGTGVRGSIEGTLGVRNRGVSTSGGRERAYDDGGRRCSHILATGPDACADPTTAVTVVADCATRADAVATALVAMGRTRAEAWIADRPDLEVYWAPTGTSSASPTTGQPPAGPLENPPEGRSRPFPRL